MKTKFNIRKKCSTRRCENYAASPRAKFCEGCFAKAAASANLKRKVYGGNTAVGRMKKEANSKRKGYGGNIEAKGSIGNRGNIKAKGSTDNQGNIKAKGSTDNQGNIEAKGSMNNRGNTCIGRSKKAAGKRSALRRCSKMVLVLKAPWLQLILSGKKTWEIRGTQTKQRGTIHLALSGAGGQIAGQCRITKSYAINRKTLSKHFTKHRIGDLGIVTYRKPHVWEISHVRRYKQPFVYDHPQGAVNWVRL